MFSYSTLTLFIALMAAVATAVEIPVEFNLIMNFEGSFDGACSVEGTCYRAGVDAMLIRRR